MLSGLPSTILNPLSRVLNAAVSLVAGLGTRDHVTEKMKELHWLPIKYRINFKLCLMMHAAVTGQCQQYIRDIVHRLSALSGRKKVMFDLDIRLQLIEFTMQLARGVNCIVERDTAAETCR